MAALDIRQNSRFHDIAFGQLLASAGFETSDFGDWSLPRRLELLNRELSSSRPFLRSGVSAGPEADAVVGALRVVADHLATYGDAGLGALIVSMTRDVFDLLLVYVFAREAGLTISTDEGWTCALKWRHLKSTDNHVPASLLNELLLSINAIAGALGATG